MDLLQTILRSCQAENYYNNFKNNGMDSYTLQILGEEDLEVIGIKDGEERKKILKHFSNLQIPSEKKINILVNKHYTQLVLTQMSEQLHRHLAILTYALKREDTHLCKITISPSVHCLQDILCAFEKKLKTFDSKVPNKVTKEGKQIPVVIPTVLIGSLALIIYWKYITS